MSLLHTITPSRKDRIMRRVWCIFFLKRITSRASLRVMSALTIVGYVVTAVSLEAVVDNMRSLSGGAALFQYVLNAIIGTEIAVQASLAALGGLLYMMVRDMQATALVRSLVSFSFRQ